MICSALECEPSISAPVNLIQSRIPNHWGGVATISNSIHVFENTCRGVVKCNMNISKT